MRHGVPTRYGITVGETVTEQKLHQHSFEVSHFAVLAVHFFYLSSVEIASFLLLFVLTKKLAACIRFLLQILDPRVKA